MELMTFVPRVMTSTNSMPDTQHLAHLCRSYQQVFVAMPFSSEFMSSADRDDLAHALQFIETLATPVWLTVEWPEILVGSTAQLSYQDALTKFSTQITYLSWLFSTMNKSSLIRGFHFTNINHSTRFIGEDESTKGLDRSFVNQLVELAHLANVRCAIDSEHPSELVTLIAPPTARSTADLEGFALAPSLLGQDSSKADVILMKDPISNVAYTNGVIPGNVMRLNGSRLGEMHGMARGRKTSNLLFWPYQRVQTMSAPPDLHGGTFIPSHIQKTISGLRSLFEVLGYTTFGVGAFEQSGYRQLFPSGVITSEPDAVPNETGSLSKIWSSNGQWYVEYVEGTSVVTHIFNDTVYLESVQTR